MCVNQRLITNIYTKKELYVPCGKCPACLQEKAAHRVSRIQNTKSDAVEVMMVGLTYSRGTAPYILRDEAYKFSKGKIYNLQVYRDSSFRKIRVSSDYKIDYKRTDETVVLQQIPFIGNCSFEHTNDLAKEPGKVGITYYPDLQRFMARLRLNLKRNFNYNETFKAYCCSEYGSKSHRPHFHILFFIRRGDFEIMRSAIIASWPFSNLQNFPRAIEKCFRGSSYVASYVNSGSRFSSFLKTYFKPKHSYSKGFGVGNSLFNLPSILHFFDRGTLSFGMQRDKRGIPTIVNVPFPAYVIHRFFPKFKGYNRISPSAFDSVMRGISSGDYEWTNHLLNVCSRELDSPCIYYSEKEFHQFNVMLNNAYQRFIDNAPERYKSLSFDGYNRLHRKIWNLHASTVLRLNMENKDLYLFEKYNNMDYVDWKYKHDGVLPVGFTEHDLNILDPNKYPHTIERTVQFEQSYHDNIKHRRVVNTIMSLDSDEW